MEVACKAHESSIAIPSPFSYQGRFNWVGQINKIWMALALFLKAVPELVQTNGSVLPGRSSDTPSLPDPPPFPFLPSLPVFCQKEPENGFVTIIKWQVIIDESLQGDRMLWLDPCLRSHCFMTFSVSLSSLGDVTAERSTGMRLWSSLGRLLDYHFSQHFFVYDMS